MVGSVNPTPATSQQYVPSTITPKPTAPAAPTGVAAVEVHECRTCVVDGTDRDGGSLITGYDGDGLDRWNVFDDRCVDRASVTGLTATAPSPSRSSPRNAIGPSVRFGAVTDDHRHGVTAMTVPNRPGAPTVVAVRGVARVTFAARHRRRWTDHRLHGHVVFGSGGRQDLLGRHAGGDATERSTCDVTGLDLLTLYTFTVTATNAVGTSPTSPTSLAVTPLVTLGAAPALPRTPSAPAVSAAARGHRHRSARRRRRGHGRHPRLRLRCRRVGSGV